jgi:hypothetical protein
MNYLQYIFDAVDYGSSVPVYTFSAPQGTTEDHIVVTIQSVDITENKDLNPHEEIMATLFLHFNDADEAQAELSAIRTAIKTDVDYISATMDGVQFFYDDTNERILLAADFLFILKP